MFPYLLMAYGICFGLMNDKAPLVPLMRRISVIDQMLDCAYCTGFHCGWMVWIAHGCVEGFPHAGTILVWAFTSAVFCYGLDLALQRLEK